MPQRQLAEHDDPNQSWPDEIVAAPAASSAKATAAGPPGGAYAVDVDARGAAAGVASPAGHIRAIPVAPVEPDSIAAHAAGSVTHVNGANAVVVSGKPSAKASSAVETQLTSAEGGGGPSTAATTALASRPRYADAGASSSAQPPPGLEDPGANESLCGPTGGAARRPPPPPVGLPSPDPWQPYPTSHLPTVRTREELMAALEHTWEAHPSNLPEVRAAATIN